jgi:hypothetical protein
LGEKLKEERTVSRFRGVVGWWIECRSVRFPSRFISSANNADMRCCTIARIEIRIAVCK